MTQAANEPGQRHDAVTSGTDDRRARPLRRPVVVDLPAAVQDVLGEQMWANGDRNSQTVATTDRMRIVVTALRAGAALGSEELDDTLALQVLEGAVTVRIDDAEASLHPGQLATIEAPGSWEARAERDSLILMTSALGAGHDSHDG